MQKKAIRAINNLDYNEHTNDYFKLNNIIKLEDQFKIQISQYIYQLKYLNIDDEIGSKLTTSCQTHDYDTRNGEKLITTRVHRSKSKNSIYHNGIKIWNSLPNEIRMKPSYYQFKKKTRKYFHGKY